MGELKRQYDSSLYERIALSADKSKVYKLALEGQTLEAPKDMVKDPCAGLVEASISVSFPAWPFARAFRLKVNYEKAQTVDEGKYPVLAKM